MGKGKSNRERQSLIKPSLSEQTKHALITSNTSTGIILRSSLESLNPATRKRAIEALIEEGLVKEEKTQVLVRDKNGISVREGKAQIVLTEAGRKLSKKIKARKHELAQKERKERLASQLKRRIKDYDLSKLSLPERDVLMILLCASQSKQGLYPNQKYVQKRLGISAKDLRQALELLQTRRWVLKVEHRKATSWYKGHPTHYVLEGKAKDLASNLTAYARLIDKPFEQVAQEVVYQIQKP